MIAVAGAERSPHPDTDRTVITYVLPGLGLFTVYVVASCVALYSSLDFAPTRVTVTAKCAAPTGFAQVQVNAALDSVDTETCWTGCAMRHGSTASAMLPK